MEAPRAENRDVLLFSPERKKGRKKGTMSGRSCRISRARDGLRLFHFVPCGRRKTPAPADRFSLGNRPIGSNDTPAGASRPLASRKEARKRGRHADCSDCLGGGCRAFGHLLYGCVLRE